MTQTPHHHHTLSLQTLNLVTLMTWRQKSQLFYFLTNQMQTIYISAENATSLP